MQPTAAALHPPSPPVQATSACVHAGSQRARAAVERAADGRATEEDRAVIDQVLRSHLRDDGSGPSLERRFGIARTPSGKDLVGRPAFLDEAIRQFATDNDIELFDAPEAVYSGLTRAGLNQFAKKWDDFVSRGRWPAWRGLAEPPLEHAEPLDVAFFHLTVANAGEALTVSGLRSLLAKTANEITDEGA